MLSKEDLNKKKGKISEQLDLVDSVDTSDKIQKKRLMIFLFLFLTIGLSTVFYVYRQIVSQSFHFDFTKMSFKFSVPSIIPRSDPTASLLSSDPNSWTICLYDLASSSLIYSKNCHLTSLPQSLPPKASVILKSLPSGLDIKENISSGNQFFEFSTTIFSPARRLFLIAKVFGSSSLADSQKLLPSVADALYWRFSRP